MSDLSGLQTFGKTVQDIGSATLLKMMHCLYTQFQKVLRQGNRVLLLDKLRKTDEKVWLFAPCLVRRMYLPHRQLAQEHLQDKQNYTSIHIIKCIHTFTGTSNWRCSLAGQTSPSPRVRVWPARLLEVVLA